MPLKYLSNSWRTLEMFYLNFEINFILTWYQNCVISSATGKTKFAITDTTLYVPTVTLSTQDHAKMLEQLRSVFKRTINWNEYQSKLLRERQNQYLDFLTDPSFQGVNKLLLSFIKFYKVLLFENENDRKVHTRCYLPKVEIKDYNVVIDGKNFFGQPVRSE